MAGCRAYDYERGENKKRSPRGQVGQVGQVVTSVVYPPNLAYPPYLPDPVL